MKIAYIQNKVLLIGFVLLVCFIYKTRAEEFDFKHFSFENGLNSISVNCIMQDSRVSFGLGRIVGFTDLMDIRL